MANRKARTDENVKSLTVNVLFRHYLEIKEISEFTRNCIPGYHKGWRGHGKEIHIRRTLGYKDYGDGLRLHVTLGNNIIKRWL